MSAMKNFAESVSEEMGLDGELTEEVLLEAQRRIDAIDPTIKPGDQCVTLSYGKVRGSARNWVYHQPAVYEAVILHRDSLAWKYVRHVGRAHRSMDLALRSARDYGMVNDIPFILGIRQWSRIEVDPFLLHVHQVIEASMTT